MPWTASSGSSWAPTTICPSRSSRANCWRGCARSCAARRPTSKPDVLRFGRLEIDRGAREVRLDGERAPLTGHQFALLLALAEHAGRVLSREALMDLLKNERAGSLRPLDRRACLAHPRRDRGRSEKAAPHHHRARRRLRVRQAAGLSRRMRRLYHQIYLTIVVSLLLVVLVAGAIWRFGAAEHAAAGFRDRGRARRRALLPPAMRRFRHSRPPSAICTASARGRRAVRQGYRV